MIKLSAAEFGIPPDFHNLWKFFKAFRSSYLDDKKRQMGAPLTQKGGAAAGLAAGGA
jgi:hypothetical protein